MLVEHRKGEAFGAHPHSGLNSGGLFPDVLRAPGRLASPIKAILPPLMGSRVSHGT